MLWEVSVFGRFCFRIKSKFLFIEKTKLLSPYLESTVALVSLELRVNAVIATAGALGLSRAARVHCWGVQFVGWLVGWLWMCCTSRVKSKSISGEEREIKLLQNYFENCQEHLHWITLHFKQSLCSLLLSLTWLTLTLTLTIFPFSLCVLLTSTHIQQQVIRKDCCWWCWWWSCWWWY